MSKLGNAPLTHEEFVSKLRSRQLDPAHQDTAAMHLAWEKLHRHLGRLRTDRRPADTQPLSVFDVDRLRDD